MKISLLALAVLLAAVLRAADFEPAATATNQLGIELFREVAAGAKDGNVLLSPFSIQSALAMTYAGAAGDTRAEMARVLHFPVDDAPLAASFHAFLDAMEAAVKNSEARTHDGRNLSPLEWHLANRLFGQTGYAFRPSFLSLVGDSYGAPLELADFKTASEPARLRINGWVEEQTHQKIHDLIPPNGLTASTRLVLVNALYFKSAWEYSFLPGQTSPHPFLVHGTTSTNQPTMRKNAALFGYAKHEGYTAVTLPYLGGDLQFLILLPDNPTGLDALAAAVTPALLKDCAGLTAPEQKVNLFLPKFRLEPPTIPLKAELLALGLHSAFDLPPGSANFDRMAPRQPDEYLFIGAVFHKTFLALDENGTEAAAATAVAMMAGAARPQQPPAPPIDVHVDHPFLFAIQHRESGICLFLGQVTDPR
jgi:serpin B